MPSSDLINWSAIDVLTKRELADYDIELIQFLKSDQNAPLSAYACTCGWHSGVIALSPSQDARIQGPKRNAMKQNDLIPSASNA